MPFSPFASRYRIWLVEDKKCLVLNEDLSFTFTGVGNEDEKSQTGSSKSQLFIFGVFRHVTCLTIKFSSQLRSSRKCTSQSFSQGLKPLRFIRNLAL